MAMKTAQLPSPVVPWVDGTGKPTQVFIQFMAMFAVNPLGKLVDAKNDSAAAESGVEVGQIYLKNGVYSTRMS